jgi:hypothetical protein
MLKSIHYLLEGLENVIAFDLYHCPPQMRKQKHDKEVAEAVFEPRHLSQESCLHSLCHAAGSQNNLV